MKNVMKRAFVSAAATSALALTGALIAPAAMAADGAGGPDISAGVTTQVCEKVPGEYVLASGKMTWAIRDSFNSYILNGPAQGAIEATDGTMWDGKAFSFNAGEGSFSVGTHAGSFNFPGTIHYTGHGGVLDLTFSNMRLVAGEGAASIHLDVKGKALDGSVFDKKDVNFADVDFSGHTHEGPKTLFNEAPATLTKAGAEAFAGFYKAGEPLAPATGELVLAPKEVCTDKPVDENPSDKPGKGEQPGGTDQPGGSDEPSDQPGGGDKPGDGDKPGGDDGKQPQKPGTDGTTKPGADKGTDGKTGDKGKTDSKGTVKIQGKADTQTKGTNPKAGKGKPGLAKTGATVGTVIALSAGALGLGVLIRRRRA